MDDSFGHWLAGFTDGEGAFTICHVTSRNGNPHNRIWPNCRFEITLRMDDAEILRTIRDTLGIGNLTIHTKPQKERPGSKGAMRFTAGRIADCLKIVEFFHRYPLRAKKQAQFMVWADAVHEMAKGSERSDAFVEECRSKLSALRVFVPPTDLPGYVAGNPPVLKHRRDYGTAPTCLCGCGAPTKIVSSSKSVIHPDNHNYSAFSRGHNRRLLAKR